MKLFLKAHAFSHQNSIGGSYLVMIEVNPKGPSVECDLSGTPLNCFKIFSLECGDQYETKGEIKISLIRKKSFGRKSVDAELTLPLLGFEVDKTVRNVYPTSNENITADIEVHLSTDPNAKAFRVPAGKFDFNSNPYLATSVPQNPNHMTTSPPMEPEMQQPTLYAQPYDGVSINGQNVSFPGQYLSAEQMNANPPPIPPVEETNDNPYSQQGYGSEAPQYTYAQHSNDNPYQ